MIDTYLISKVGSLEVGKTYEMLGEIQQIQDRVFLKARVVKHSVGQPQMMVY